MNQGCRGFFDGINEIKLELKLNVLPYGQLNDGGKAVCGERQGLISLT
jgi:hypothetical protein